MSTPDKQSPQSLEAILEKVTDSFTKHLERIQRVRDPEAPSFLINGAYSRLIEALACERQPELASELMIACEQEGHIIDRRAKAFVLAACGHMEQAVQLVQEFTSEPDERVIGEIKGDYDRIVAELCRFFARPDEAVTHEVRHRITDAKRKLAYIDEERQEVERNPNNFEALLSLAEILESSSDPRHLNEGVEIANRALEIEPEDCEILGLLADIHKKLGNTYEEIKALEAAIRLKGEYPEFEDGHNERCIRLAVLYHQTGNYNEAARAIRELLKTNPENPEMQLILKFIESRRGQSSD